MGFASDHTLQLAIAAVVAFLLWRALRHGGETFVVHRPPGAMGRGDGWARDGILTAPRIP